MTPYGLALELTLVFAVWLGIGAWQRDPDARARFCFAALAGSVALWCAGDLLLARGSTGVETALRVKYLGVLCLPSLWLGLAAHAAHLDVARRTPWFPAALLVPPLMLYPLLYLGPWGVLFVSVDDAGNQLRGPLWWVHCAYAYGLVLAGTALFMRAAWSRGESAFARERLAIGAGSLVPLLGNALYMLAGFRWEHDPTPVLLGVTLVVLRGSLFAGSLLDVLPVAQRDLIAHLPFGVVLTDGEGTVIDVNPAAEELLDLPGAEAIGRALDAVLAHAPLGLQIEVSPVRVRGREAARFALLEPPKPSATLDPGAG